MQLTEHRPDGLFVIHSLRNDFIRVGEEHYSRSLLITPDQGVQDWPVTAIDQMNAQHLEAIFACDPEVVILASGRRMQFPSREIQLEFLKRSIGLEVMALEAAARTYNVLASEDRKVLGALIWEAGN